MARHDQTVEAPARKVRADGLRNRERLIEAAKASFADHGADATLDQIAKRAGVGIGTLYRHFPTRDAVVEAVYRREVQHLADAAERLIADETPAEALHGWMRLFVDYIAAKKLIVPALQTMVGDHADLYAASTAQITGAMQALVGNAVTAGEIRADADAMDLLRGLVGFTYAAPAPGWQASALRLIDLLMDGLRPK